MCWLGKRVWDCIVECKKCARENDLIECDMIQCQCDMIRCEYNCSVVWRFQPKALRGCGYRIIWQYDKSYHEDCSCSFRKRRHDICLIPSTVQLLHWQSCHNITFHRDCSRCRCWDRHLSPYVYEYCTTTFMDTNTNNNNNNGKVRMLCDLGGRVWRPFTLFRSISISL